MLQARMERRNSRKSSLAPRASRTAALVGLRFAESPETKNSSLTRAIVHRHSCDCARESIDIAHGVDCRTPGVEDDDWLDQRHTSLDSGGCRTEVDHVFT